MLAEVVARLRCPHCAAAGTDAPVAETDRALRCPRGHSFDIAREGYVNLLRGAAPAATETPEMVAARDRVLSAGHFDVVVRAVTAAAQAAPTRAAPGFVLDAGAGTGHYLAAVLQARSADHGLALDLARTAVRRAARTHPRAAAAVADVWRGLPLAGGCADVVLNVFAPRNGPEFRRVLRAGGRLVIVTPTPGHLAELVPLLGLITVDPDKEQRLEASLGSLFRLRDRTRVEHRLSLAPAEVADLVAMGPSAWHTDPDQVADRVAGHPGPVTITASVTVHTYEPT
jgi:23S rRNA (guanine745-N1)-methyltransferase